MHFAEWTSVSQAAWAQKWQWRGRLLDLLEQSNQAWLWKGLFTAHKKDNFIWKDTVVQTNIFLYMLDLGLYKHGTIDRNKIFINHVTGPALITT